MKLTLFALLLLISNCIYAQTIDKQKLDDYLNCIESSNLGIGSISIFNAGKEVYSKDFGQKNLSNGGGGQANQYHVGSVTKMFTATLIFKLIEDGQFKLDDKLAAFYPEIPNAQKITIKNLLGHTSGLGSYVVKDGEVWVTEKVTEKAILDLIIKQGVSFEPGEKVDYSNTGYYLLAKIIEKKYKKPYHELINKLIVKPLKLKSLASIKSNPQHVYAPYEYVNKSWSEKKDLDFLNVIGVGDIVSTPKELNIFNENLFRGKIIKTESLQMMMPIVGKETWGRGMAICDFDGITFYGHGGDTLGSHTVLIYNPEADISIAYATNGERIVKEDFIKNIIYVIYNKPFQLPVVK
ncbi:serine hydrolase domain-containing protein [Mucilaginibacter psychrotolerans]|uniref:Class A beta-lactamase-related serine hydrolase n=1 Tax=Mucilaginibacter psychrotolerans TaxID=1524096 RepID=A0A4Y8SF99_9SPHI|nr:serine hydrolase domain-containing protein [Mucilaginibacter psychrotolerans]TFF37227.1 class A beta-lactamase-related serine hydrolase [Mucilaginibacter psychrotolerans]